MKFGSVIFSLIVILSLFLLASGCTQTAAGNATATPTVTAAAEPVITPALTTNETLVAFVKEAVSYAKTNGRDAAIAEFNKANGSFVRGELYLYAYDFNGTTIAHPFNPEKIGINRINETDAHGNYFIKDLRDAAKNGTGFVGSITSTRPTTSLLKRNWATWRKSTIPGGSAPGSMKVRPDTVPGKIPHNILFSGHSRLHPYYPGLSVSRCPFFTAASQNSRNSGVYTSSVLMKVYANSTKPSGFAVMMPRSSTQGAGTYNGSPRQAGACCRRKPGPDFPPGYFR